MHSLYLVGIPILDIVNTVKVLLIISDNVCAFLCREVTDEPTAV